VKRAGEREAFILGAPIGWFWKRLYSEIGFPPSHESSNNPLAAEPESENDAARFFRKTYCRFYLWSKRPPPATTKGFIQMINTLKRATRLAPSLSFAAILAIALPAFAQAPSQAQRDAIKSQCRSDYMAHCSSVPPGGEASLQCLQKNMAGLSSGCQGAVRAVEAPAAATAKPAETAKPTETAKPAETAAPKAAAPAAAATAAPKAAEPKTAEPKAAAAPAAGQPTSAQVSAIRSACRSDYPKVCAGVPTGGAPALQCLEKNKAKLSAGCGKAVSAASGGGAPAAAATAAGAAPAAAATAPAGAAAAAAPAAIVLRPMRPREELFVLRSACGADVRSICGSVPPGGGRIVQCLATNAAQLSPACKDVMSQFAAR
jgi:hypothetical protein